MNAEREDRVIQDAFDSEKLRKQTRLPLICIYDHPTDYPGHFVARVWDLNTPTRLVALSPTLEGIREHIPSGMARIPRSEHDDPHIVEVWI